jgi:hypothetical protein
MSKVNILRLKLWQRLFYLIFFFGVTAFASWFVIRLFPLTWEFRQTPTGKLDWINIFLVTLPISAAGVFLILIAMTGYTAIFWWKLRLEFSASHIKLVGFYNPFLKSFNCRYEDIKQITGGEMRHILTIVTNQGKPLRIYTSLFEGGAKAILNELSKRVGADKFAPNIMASLQAYSRSDRQYLGFLVILSTALLWFYYLPPFGHSFILDKTAWTSAQKFDWLTSVQAFAVDSNASPWVITRTLSPTTYQVVHVAGNEKWDLPTESELLQIQDSEFGYRPDLIAIDNLGRPWVSLFPRGLIHWTGTSWEWFIFPGNEIRVDVRYLAATESAVWVYGWPDKLANGKYMLKIDPATGESLPLSLPESAIQKELKIRDFRISPDGSLLILAESIKNGRDTYIYRFSNDQWQEMVLLNTFSEAIEDFSTTPSGQIWALLGQSGCPPKPNYQIGVYDANKSLWNWSNISSNASCEENAYYKTAEVDSRNRLWLETSKAVEVFEISSGNDAHLIVSYTPENSNYQNDYSDAQLYLAKDGRLWAADEKLVWIDGNVATLPEPLPDWLATIASLEVRAFVWMPIFVALTLVNLTFVLRRNRLLTSNLKKVS